MADFNIRVRAFARSRGASGSAASRAVAHRSSQFNGEERAGRLFDQRRGPDVIQKEIVLPAQLVAQRGSLAWTRDRRVLWTAAEHAEPVGNARIAREFVVSLPRELLPERREQLAMQFAHSIADRYRSAVDVGIYPPRGNASDYQAHLLVTTREITAEGFGRKTTLELNGTGHKELGLPRWRDEIRSLREEWGGLTRAALQASPVPERATHLGRAERGHAPSQAPYVSDARKLATSGRSMVRNIGARVGARWKAMQEEFRVHFTGAGLAGETTVSSVRGVTERGREYSGRPNSLAAQASATTNRPAEMEGTARKSAQDRAAARMQPGREAPEPEDPAHQPGREPAQESGAGRRGNDYGL